MPHLVQMDRRYSNKGLVLIGAESQQSGTEAIEEIVKDKRIKFAITKGASGPVDVEGLPHMVVFDTTGKLVFSGHDSGDAEKAIKKALRGATVEEGGDSDAFDIFKRNELIAERTWTNEDGKSLTASLIKLEGDTGTFRRPNGSTFSYDITKLSEADQKVIADTVKGDAEEDEEEGEE